MNEEINVGGNEEPNVGGEEKKEDIVVTNTTETVRVDESEPLLEVSVSFDDEQLKKILSAGLEPAQVRNEIGLEFISQRNRLTEEHGDWQPSQVRSELAKIDPRLSLSEAIKRALVKYPKN